jgi:hypothetical protein
MPRSRLLLLVTLSLFGRSGSASAQWPALYFRADPFLRLDLSCPDGGSSFGLAVHSYSAEAYFDGLDQTPHTSKADVPSVRFQREEYVFSSTIGLSRRTAIVVSLPVSHVRQRLFETGDWGVEKVWLGATHALDHSHHFSALVAAALPVDGAVGNLHSPVAVRDRSGVLTAQFILSHAPLGRAPHLYLRFGAGVYTSKEEYYGRRLYEFPGEFRASVPVVQGLRVGLGGEGRFVMGAPDDRLFARTLTSHDAFAFGPDLFVSLTPEADLHATYRHEVFGFYATAGSYWNIVLAFNLPRHVTQ